MNIEELKLLHEEDKKKFYVLEHEIKKLEEEISNNQKLCENKKSRIEILTMALAVLQDIIEKVSYANIRKIEQILNQALSSIFYDLNLEIKIISEIKRNNTVYDFKLYQDGMPRASITDSYGGSVACVIAAVSKIIFNLLTKKARVIVFDESLNFISVQYIPSTAKFLKELAHSLGMTIILVTHQEMFKDLSEINYHAEKASDGSTIFNKTVYE